MPTRYDRNRHRKIYPINRKRPVYVVTSTIAGAQIETATVTFSNSLTQTYTFTSSYSAVPIVVATGDNNVNVYISAINTTEVVINTSEAFTGNVYLQITAS